MDFGTAIKQVTRSGMTITRTAWRDASRIVYLSEKGNVVERRGGSPPVLWMPNQEEMLCGDWEFPRR